MLCNVPNCVDTQNDHVFTPQRSYEELKVYDRLLFETQHTLKGQVVYTGFFKRNRQLLFLLLGLQRCKEIFFLLMAHVVVMLVSIELTMEQVLSSDNKLLALQGIRIFCGIWTN